MKDETITELNIGGLRILQARKGYRFSLDPILLCNFVDIPQEGRVADLGTGSGIIPLLLNHLGKGSSYYGIERQLELACRAQRSVELNGLQGNIEIFQGDVCNLPAGLTAGFDVVVSNPPYRKESSGRIASGDERAMARHELSGGLDDFLRAANSLLDTGGRFYIVYLAERLAELLTEMRSVRLEPKRLRMVHSREGAPARMVLVEGRKGGNPGMTVEAPLIVYEGEGREYTKEVLAMYEMH